jgi:hypothetical protein
MRTQVRKFVKAAEGGDHAEVAGLLGATVGALDKAVQKGLIKKGRADRLKSRMTIRTNKLKTASAGSNPERRNRAPPGAVSVSRPSTRRSAAP